MKYKSLLTHLSLTSVVFLCAMVSAADAQPACRAITNPSPGSVCYTEWQFSSRQRGEGGTKTHEQLVERVEPNYVIVDTEVIVQESNGITSKPTPNIVSSSGNASIVNETSSSIRELTEVKNSLQNKAAGCVPPVCGQIQNQLDTVNQKISEYSERKRVAIEAGGNEKILFKWTTKVECSQLGICGPGAWMNGVIRVYQRYLGNPSAIKQETLSLVASSQSAIITPQYFFSPPWVEENLAKYPMFDAQWYLQQNSDVNNACRGNLECARQHYLANGLKECRNASRYFNPRWYLENYPDVKSVFKNCRGASEHWSGAGIAERRPGAPGVPAP